MAITVMVERLSLMFFDKTFAFLEYYKRIADDASECCSGDHDEGFLRHRHRDLSVAAPRCHRGLAVLRRQQGSCEPSNGRGDTNS